MKTLRNAAPGAAQGHSPALQPHKPPVQSCAGSQPAPIPAGEPHPVCEVISQPLGGRGEHPGQVSGIEEASLVLSSSSLLRRWVSQSGVGIAAPGTRLH